MKTIIVLMLLKGLENILNCYSTQVLGVVQTKRKLYSPLNYNKLLHVLEKYMLSQSSDNIDRKSRGTMAYLQRRVN